MINIRWLGGFFDGEGCVCIERNAAGAYRLVVTITQYDRPILRAIQAQFGGNTTGNYGHQIRWGDAQAEVFLRKILPFVRVKRKVVKLGLQHRQLIGYGSRRSVWQNRAHDKIRKRISYLNKHKNI